MPINRDDAEPFFVLVKGRQENQIAADDRRTMARLNLQSPEQVVFGAKQCRRIGVWLPLLTHWDREIASNRRMSPAQHSKCTDVAKDQNANSVRNPSQLRLLIDWLRWFGGTPAGRKFRRP